MLFKALRVVGIVYLIQCMTHPLLHVGSETFSIKKGFELFLRSDLNTNIAEILVDTDRSQLSMKPGNKEKNNLNYNIMLLLTLILSICRSPTD